MFDVWWGNTNLALVAFILSVVLVLPVQLLLCFKVKNRTICLLPIIFLLLLTALFIFLALSIPDIGAVGYAFFAVYTGFMIFMCGIGWGIWWIINRKKQRRPTE